MTRRIVVFARLVDARARDDVRRLSKDDARAIELAIARQNDEKDVKVIARDENETTMARVEDARAAVESAVETFSTRLRNVKEAVSADASRATACLLYTSPSPRDS